MSPKPPELTPVELMTPEAIEAERQSILNTAQSMQVDTSGDLLRPDQLEQATQDFKEEQKYGDRPIAATAAALASGLTFSLSDRALEQTGLVSEETLAGLSKHNEAADIVGQVGGALIPAFLTAGASAPESAAAMGVRGALKVGAKAAIKATPAALAERAGLAIERKVAKAIGTAAAESGQKKLIAEVVRKSIAKGAGSAVEGAAFGANQLLREDAIGKAELNAENLLSYAGEGALIGGGLGAALVPGGALLKGIGGGLSKGLKKAGTSIFDPVRDAAKLMDLTPAQIARFETKNPQFLERLPDWLKNKADLKWNSTPDSLLSKLETIEQSATTRIDDAVSKLDQKMGATGNGIGPKVYNDLANHLETEFVAPYANMKSMEGFSNKAKELVDDFRMKANDTRLELRRLSFEEIREMRQKMDKLAKSFYKSMDPSDGARAAFAARDGLKKVLTQYADLVDPQLAREMADANLDYHMAVSLRPRLSIKAEKSKDFINFRDAFLAGAGVELGGPAGLTIAAANKFLNSDLKRKMVILGQIEKGTQTVAKRTEEAMSNFFTKSSRPAKIASIGILTRSELGRAPGSDEKPKNKIVAFRNVQNNIVSLAADPSKMQDRMAKSTHILAYAAPQTAAAMGATMQRAVQFLARKAPKDARDIGMPMWEPEYEPSSVELSKFERYMQVIEQPLSVLSDLEGGTLTRDHVEALKAVYPNLYNDLRVAAMKQAEVNPKLTYNKRIQMGILLDLPTDSSLSPQFIMQMQSLFVPPEQRQEGQLGANGTQQGQPAVQPTQGGAQNVDSANRNLTSTQKVAQNGVGG